MKKIYFLFFFCFFAQVMSAQNKANQKGNSANPYSLAVDFRGGPDCNGRTSGCTGDQLSVLRSGKVYQALGSLWFDKYGRVMLELEKNSLNKELQEDIFTDGLLSLSEGWELPTYLLDEKGLIGIVEQIPPGEYIAIEKERTVLIVLGKLN